MAFCTKCGQSNQQGARFCNSCGAILLGATVRSESSKQTAVSAPRRAEPATVLPRPQIVVVQSGIKSSGLAAVLSFFWSGLGQVYLGKMGLGIALMLAQPAMTLLGLGLTTRGSFRDERCVRARRHVPDRRNCDMDLRHDQRLPHNRANERARPSALLSARHGWIRMMAFATWIIAFAAVANVFVYWRISQQTKEQITLTKEQIDLTRKLFLESHKPELSVAIGDCEYSEPDGIFEGRIMLANHGAR